MLTIDKHNILGKGSFATVFSGLLDGQAVAVKRIDRGAGSSKETAILMRLNHPNIIKLLGEFTENSMRCIVLEFMDAGDLFALGGQLNTSNYASITNDIVSGLAYLHSRHILHRDLKPENILLNRNMQAKITDFGFALDEQDATTHGLVGTIHFLAPELALAYQDHKICVYTRKTDIFALGVTLFQMLLNEMPYQLEDGEMVSCSTIAKGQFRTIPTAKHPLVADFISRCIIQAPDARIETEVLSALSPYLLDVNDTTSEKTPLWFLAVKHRLTHFIRKLLNQTPELLNATDELNQTALLWSAGKGYDEIVSLLIMLHADVNIAAQIPSNHPEFENHNMSALDWAMQNEYCQSTLLLTQAGAIANKIDSFIKGTSLLRMMQNGSIEFIQMLINHNPVFLNQIDNKGHALLHYAAMCGQLDIMRDLIKKGAEVNIKDTRNQSPLLWAASKGHHEMVAFLITQGADINSSTRNSVSEHHNYTPLDWASLGKHTQTIAILKAAGAISNHQIVENKPDSVPNSHSFFKRPQSTESTTNDLPKKRSFES